MTKSKRVWLILAAIPVLGLALFFATASYGVEPYHGIRYISRSPVATITWGPANSYIVQHGINRVADQGMGMAGNFLEFPVSSDTRVSMRLFSLRWLKEEFRAWRSNHEWARPRCERDGAADPWVTFHPWHAVGACTESRIESAQLAHTSNMRRSASATVPSGEWKLTRPGAHVLVPAETQSWRDDLPRRRGDRLALCEQIVSVEIHHLAPSRDEVVYELPVGIVAGIYLGQGA